MAMLILLTTAGFSLHRHHCIISKKTIISVAHIKNCCGTEGKEQDCPKECCQDETEFFQLDTEISLPATAHDFTPEQFIAVVQHCVLSRLFDQHVERSSSYLNYKPPLLLRDIPVIVQSFLI